MTVRAVGQWLTRILSGPYDTALGLDMVYTLAAQLIESCPDSNAMLPVKAYPSLTIMGSPIANAAAGSEVQLSFNASSSGMMNAAIYSGSTLFSCSMQTLTLFFLQMDWDQLSSP